MRTEITPVDVYENDDEFLVVADMPGANPATVHIELEKDALSVTAKREAASTGQVLFGGHPEGEFKRTFQLPPGVDAARVSADISQGVLKVHLPKGAAAKPRTIAVTTRN